MTIKKSQLIILSSFLFMFYSIEDTITAQNKFVDSLKLVVNNVETIKNPDKGAIKSAVILSDIYSKISLDSSKHYGFIAYDFATRAKNDTGLAVSLNMIGMAYLSSGFYDSAAPFLDSALGIFQSMGDTTGLVFVRNNLAVVMKTKGNYTQALKLYQENLLMAQSRHELENMLLSYNNMGIAYYDWKKYDEALKNYNLALAVLDSLGEENRKGSLYNNIGELYKTKGDEAKALEFFQKALPIHKKYNRQRSVMISTMNIGDIYMNRDDLPKAQDYLNEALVISEKIPDYSNASLLHIKLGELFVKKKNAGIALRHLEKGLKMALDNDLKQNILEAYKTYVDYARLINDSELMYKYSSLYNQLNDSLFSQESLNTISEMETKFKTAEKEKEIAVLKVEQKNSDLEIQLQRNQKYLIVILLLLVIIVAFYVFNRNRLRQIKEKADMEKQKVLIEQRLLRTQMNPHFIFNSLNSINNFIGGNDAAQAQKYLSKFARLMRLILENSRKSTVSLDKEIASLELNLELEQLRFDNNFDFEINIDDNIEPEDIYLSPMLIQPFVENAVKHGLKKNEKGGFVSLKFYIKDELLYCEITDNGIGRKAAAGKGLHRNRHQSLGTQVTNERLAILKQDYGKESGYEIIDLEDENSNAIGTKVIVRIPFEED
ncbi:MAG: tetratricopeptide repeat protein [Chlorobi bacterium]|nr:tetratricopeptide repeat protein [Chlorobiota bacterium]